MERTESENERNKNLSDADKATATRLDSLSERITTLEKNIGFIQAYVVVNQDILNAVYAVVKANNHGEYIPMQDLDNGVFDTMSARFWVSREQQLRKYNQ